MEGGRKMSRNALDIEVIVSLKRMGKTKKWLAEQIGISQSYLTDILHGNRIANDKVELICELLGINQPKESK